MAWKYGGKTERAFVFLFGIMALMIVFLVTLTILEYAYRNWPFVAISTTIIAVFSLPAFTQAILAPLYSAAFLRESVRRDLVRFNKQYYEEYARYIEAYGVSGHLKGDVAWGVAFWGLCNGNIAGGIIFATIFYPILGDLTFWAFVALELPLALGCYFIYGRRTYRQFQEAQLRGFRLLELRPGLDG